MENTNNKPFLRFKGFTDTWEQYKLSQLYDFSKGRGLSLDSFYEGNDSLGIAYGHLYTKYTEVINKITLSTYDESGVLSRKGDLLFPGSSTVPFGTAQSNAIMLDNVKLGGDVIIARARNLDIYAPFISYQINAQKSKLFPITVGTTITHMYGKDIANIEYKFPKYDEQVKIGRTLESLDSLITLHQRKYEKLVYTKKALLEKMFPIAGEEKPRLRFKGFTETWEQCKLIDMLQQPITDGPHETPELVEKGVPFISVDAIVDNKIDFSKVRGYITEFYDEQCSKKYKPQLLDVYLVKSGSTVGKVAIVETNGRFNIWSPLAAMRTGYKSDPYFLYHLLQTKYLQNQVYDRCSHGTQPNLSMRELEKFDVCIPKIEEQRKISQTFNNIDNLITLHQRKYEMLQNIKKALLQKMFV